MKKFVLVLTVLMLIGGIAFAGGSSQESGDAAWKPTRTVEFTVMANPGGGTDILTRGIIDIIKKAGLSDADYVIVYNNDGNGNVPKIEHARATGQTAAHKLLSWTSGELAPMKQSGVVSMDNFIPVGIIQSEKHILLVNKNGKYKSVEDVVNAMKSGTTVTSTGAKGDDVFVYNLLCESLGVTQQQLTFVGTPGNPDALALVLGGHIDLCVSKLASAKGYLESGDLVPIATLANERYTMPYYDAPTLSELGYTNVEFPIWRGVMAGSNMPKEALDYYINMFKTLTTTPEWQKFLADSYASPLAHYGEEGRQWVIEYMKVMGL